MDERQTTKATNMKTLHLNLKRQWFDLILSGEKKEEYREIKPYWSNTLTQGFIGGENHCWDPDGTWIHFDTITFSNGYARDRDQFVIELKGIEIKEGREEWGAEPSTKYFAIQLGEITSRKLNK